MYTLIVPQDISTFGLFVSENSDLPENGCGGIEIVYIFSIYLTIEAFYKCCAGISRIVLVRNHTAHTRRLRLPFTVIYHFPPEMETKLPFSYPPMLFTIAVMLITIVAAAIPSFIPLNSHPFNSLSLTYQFSLFLSSIFSFYCSAVLDGFIISLIWKICFAVSAYKKSPAVID